MSTIQRIADGNVSLFTRRLVKGDVYYARFKITNKRVADGQPYVTESMGTTDVDIAVDRARQRYAEIKAAEKASKSIKSGSVSAEIDAFIEAYEDGVKKGLPTCSSWPVRVCALARPEICAGATSTTRKGPMSRKLCMSSLKRRTAR